MEIFAKKIFGAENLTIVTISSYLA